MKEYKQNELTEVRLVRAGDPVRRVVEASR
jgi:hypothetical protein